MTDQVIITIIALAILLKLTFYIGKKKTTGFFQILTIGFLGYLSLVFYDNNKIAFTAVSISLITIFYLKSRKPTHKKLYRKPWFKSRKKKPVKGKPLQPIVNLFSEFQNEMLADQAKEIRETKKRLEGEKKEKEALRLKNEQLRKEQEEQDSITKATPRLRYYNELARKRLLDENMDLAKLKEKRLQEEIRRQKEELRKKGN